MTDKYIPDNRIHYGHRARMRSKLMTHGAKIFDTYELLEMLLYYTVPYKDTNPISKQLLHAFSSLDGVLSADKEKLLSVLGVGEHTADLIRTVGAMSAILGAETPVNKEETYSGYTRTADFLISKLKASTEKKVVAMYLDNAMRLLSYEVIATGLDYDSAGIKPRAFIDGALRNRASVIITAHNHPYGSPYPTPGDRETNRLITDALRAAGVMHAEHYVISGERFFGMTCELGRHLFHSAELSAFEKEREAFLEGNSASLSHGYEFDEDTSNGNLDYLSHLISFASANNAEETARLLLDKFSLIEDTINTDVGVLLELVGEKTAVLLKLSAYVTSRRVTDGFAFMKKHTSAEIAEYCKAIYVGSSVESVYLICFDSTRRVVACELVGEGTVNASEVIPRRLLEAALRHSASSVILVHNHPFGTTNPSQADVNLTMSLGDLFRSVGVEFIDHLIVSGQKCEPVR